MAKNYGLLKTGMNNVVGAVLFVVVHIAEQYCRQL